MTTVIPKNHRLNSCSPKMPLECQILLAAPQSINIVKPTDKKAESQCGVLVLFVSQTTTRNKIIETITNVADCDLGGRAEVE